MLRHFLWLFAIVVLGAAGLFAILPASVPDRSARTDNDRIYTSPRFPGSIHYKTSAVRVARSGKGDIRIPNSRLGQFARAAPPRVPRRDRAGGAGTRLVAFQASPFPYDGVVPHSNKPFLNFEQNGRRGRKTGSGRVYWADRTYNDRRVLLHIPKGFDPYRPGVMVLFFHGHRAKLWRDVVTRQRVPEQITRSGMNAVLVAPQFAVDARDSSAGGFWQPPRLRRFLAEAAGRLAQIDGRPGAVRAFADMPVVIVGYSGGYLAVASALSSGVIGKRLKAVVLLDGLYGRLDTFASWIGANKSAVFVSAYTYLTRARNVALKALLREKNIAYRTEIGSGLSPGSVAFIAADAKHRDFVTRAWTEAPISDVLVKLTGIAARRNIALSALAPRTRVR